MARTPWRRVCATTIIFAAALGMTDAHASGARQEAYKRPLEIPFPSDRPYSPLVATLGKMLYFDPRVSRAQNMSCASCHNPSFGWEVPVATAIGAANKPLGRHAPTVLNQAWATTFFWDGRASTLEEQAAGPITADVEMGADMEELTRRLNGVPGYREGFLRAFPERGLTEETVLVAVATYERTIVSDWSPFDRWVDGDETAISDSAKRGFELFDGKARCAQCHSGWNFTDGKFHDIGLDTEDLGRWEIDPSSPSNRHAFKTPSLRDIAHRSPYMHNGSISDLETMIYHYIGGGIDRPSRSAEMRPLDLQEADVRDLIAFLQSLTAEQAVVATPILPVN